MTNKSKTRIGYEKAVVSAIKTLTRKLGYRPSFREIAAESGMSLGNAYETCVDLRSEGIISFTEGVARSVRMEKK